MINLKGNIFDGLAVLFLHGVEELATDVRNVTHALIMRFNFAARWEPGMRNSTISTLINCCHA